MIPVQMMAGPAKAKKFCKLYTYTQEEVRPQAL